MINTNLKNQKLQRESQMSLTGSEYLKHLVQKKAAIKKDYNRNVFSLRTNDKISFLIKKYCQTNNISANQFFNNLLKDYFNYGEFFRNY